jgi:hypothetical protein
VVRHSSCAVYISLYSKLLQFQSANDLIIKTATCMDKSNSRHANSYLISQDVPCLL